jgi:hypothetical protein
MKSMKLKSNSYTYTSDFFFFFFLRKACLAMSDYVSITYIYINMNYTLKWRNWLLEIFCLEIEVFQNSTWVSNLQEQFT